MIAVMIQILAGDDDAALAAPHEMHMRSNNRSDRVFISRAAWKDVPYCTVD